MAVPLITSQARELRRLVRPRWHRRLAAWATAFAAIVIIGVRVSYDEPGACSDAAPCSPSYLGTVSVGLLLAAVIVVFLHGRTALWLAVGFAATDTLYLIGHPAPSEWAPWLYATDGMFVAIAFLAAAVGRDHRPGPNVQEWLAGIDRETAPTPTTLPTVGRGARLGSVVCLVIAVLLGLWSWWTQVRVDEQQRVADRTSAEVVRIVDELTLEVRLSDGKTREINVFESVDYTPGQRLQFYTDSKGLFQPVSEPYDGSGWILLAVVVAGLGIGWRTRAADRAAGLHALYADPVPVSQVFVRRGNGAMTVYAGDARPGEPALAVFPTEANAREEDADSLHPDDKAHMAMLGLDPSGVQPTERAVLYGLPLPGHWCAVTIGQERFHPEGPVRPKLETLLFTEPVTSGPARPRMLRAEELEALRPDDTDPNPEQVRTHRQHPVVGYAVVLAGPLLLLGLARPLMGLPTWVQITVAAAVVAVSCAVGWAFSLRSRLSWNAGGVAVIGAIGAARLRWNEVLRIDADQRHVTLYGPDNAYVVSAGGGFGPLRDRPAEELANALRYAKQRAWSGIDPPTLVLPAASRSLPVIWIGYTPVVIWLIRLVANV